jgi:hypothetical protein
MLTLYGDLMPQLSIAFATTLADGFTVVQEWMAVTFHLVCLSRLETTADIKSCMVLFLTLVVFTGPYLNAWLLYTDHIFFKELSIGVEKILWNFLLGVLIAGAHVLGSLTASAIVRDWSSKSNSTIKWELTPIEQEKDNDLSTHVLEEMFAVASLLIGCVYLLWLKKMRNDKPEKDNEKGIPRIEIRFYFQLTLLVAAVSQAFPDAYLSPHVACYKFFMNRISVAVLFCRLGGGAVGFLISCIWCILRVNYRNGVQIVLPDEHEQKTATNYKGFQPLQKAEMPGFRLSMHGGSYF